MQAKIEAYPALFVSLVCKNQLYLLLLAACCMWGQMTMAQQGYIYLHKKASNEEQSVDFTFSLNTSPTPTSIVLNDKPDVIKLNDIGSSSSGRLYATGLDNILYYRDVTSNTWVATSIANAVRVDGGAGNTAYYTNTSGNICFFNGSIGSVICTSAGAADVAAGWNSSGVVAVYAIYGGTIYRYVGTGSSTTGSVVWPSFKAGINAGSWTYIDVIPNASGGNVIAAASNTQNTYTIDRSTGVETSLGFPAAGVNGSNPTDVAADARGGIYAIYNSNDWAINKRLVCSYSGGSWATEPTSRGMENITGGVGGQVWGLTYQTLTTASGEYSKVMMTRTVNGSGANFWLDDERVRTTQKGNSELVAVAPGTYTLTETLPSGWDLAGITIYDPSNNSSSNVSTQVSTINVSAGEIVNVVYNNTFVQTTAVGAGCGTYILQNYGSGAAEFGPVQTGLTNYHYLARSVFDDGYYSVMKNTTGWYQPTALTDHTGLANGYFLTVNASYGVDEFYRQRITGLSVGSPYTFSLWAANISNGSPIRPNITIATADVATGAVLGSVNTGDIASTSWSQYSFTFTATQASVDIVLRNNGIGGNGNDLAIDDIAFNLASPISLVTTVVGASCSSATGIITVSSPVGANIEYNINGGSFQSSPVFSNLATGIHTVSARFVNTTCTTAKTDTVRPSVCGTVFNDLNGATDNTVNGTSTNAGGTLYVALYDSTTLKVTQVVAVANNGSYGFTSDVLNNKYTLFLTSTPPTVGQTAVPTTTLPAAYVNTGEKLGAGTGSDGTANGVILLGIVGGNTGNANFGIEQPPTANPVSGTYINPGGTATVTVPTLNGSDPEQSSFSGTGNADTVVIKTLPGAGILYYDADGLGGAAPVAVVAGDTIRNYNPANLTFDPPSGSGIYTFDYVEVDAALKASVPATVTMNFSTLTLSGTVLNDINGMNNSLVDGTGTNAGGIVYANLVNPGNNQVIASVAVDALGQYSFDVEPNTSYKVILTNGPASGTLTSSPFTPGSGGWVTTGEGATAAGDGNPEGIVSVSVSSGSITGVNFGIEQPPTANAATGNFANPGGTATVQVPTLNGSDPEQGTLPGTGNLDTVIIDTRPAQGTLYYNGVAIPSNSFRINNYNPALLTYDPPAGGGTYTFTYREMDAAGKTSAPATVTLNFTDITISGIVHNDMDGGTIDGPGVGTPASTTPIPQLYANLVGSNGNIVGVVPVNADGSYNLTTENGVKPDATFTVVLSPTQGNSGNPASTLAAVGSINTTPGWVNIAEGNVGTTGDSQPDGSLQVVITGTASAGNRDFAIEQPPTAITKTATFPEIGVNEKYPLSPSADEPQPALEGTDPGQPNLVAGSTFIIASLPANAKLFYAGNEITSPGTVINDYEPGLLEFSINNAGAYTTSFNYSVVDAAGVASPATPYNINILATLPVSGLELKGIVQAGKPLLLWTTLTEQNTSHFELAKSINGTGFTVVAKLSAAGESNSLKTYTYTDNSVNSTNMQYYRVRLVDKDGRVKESNTIALSISVQIGIQVFPNPASEFVMVTGLQEAAHLLIYDAAGKLLQQVKATATSQKIPLQAVPSGLLNIQVIQAGKTVAVKKIVHQ